VQRTQLPTAKPLRAELLLRSERMPSLNPSRDKVLVHRVPMEERRSAHRYVLPLAVVIRQPHAARQSDIFQARLKDMSTGGMCFTSQEDFTVGDKFEFSVTLSTENAHMAEVFVEARAMVVRVAPQPRGAKEGACVAAVIEKFKIIRTRGGTS